MATVTKSQARLHALPAGWRIDGNCVGFNIDMVYIQGTLERINFKEDNKLGDDEIGS